MSTTIRTTSEKQMNQIRRFTKKNNNYCTITNQNGVYVHTAHMGSECITTVKIVNQGLYVKNGEWRDVGDGDYTSLEPDGCIRLAVDGKTVHLLEL